jgi:hypothetical protein
MPRSKKAYVDYQSRAFGFQIGDNVLPIIGGSAPTWPFEGTVVAIYPAIGQVDVQYPFGSQRFGVEELIIDPSAKGIDSMSSGGGKIDLLYDSVPGGVGTVRVPGGPPPQIIVEDLEQMSKEARVTERYIKKAMYWHGRDRQYRATKRELQDRNYSCPKCRDVGLRSAIYKRRQGASEKLLCCPQCMFLIKSDDVYGG